MNLKLAYLGHSAFHAGPRGGGTLSFAPNLARDEVAFDAPLLKPLRFREATSALHDVVVSDLRFKRRGDKAAYEKWKKEQGQRDAETRRGALAAATAAIEAKRGRPVPGDLERRFENARKRYWDARIAYSNYLLKHDRDLLRLLMPCDPVVTVADDVAFFECFSADESSYGCLTVSRDGGFGPASLFRPGTTNVDYSWELYDGFQALRSYRETRFRIDPAGFTVATEGAAEVREEKIDLPPGWLRGFMQLQRAMALPTRRVTVSREAVYSILAWHRRHRARTSPRALRFELEPGRAPRLVLEPWEAPIESRGPAYDGPGGPPIRVWGVRRLLSLARLLPLAEGFDVHLLGTGLPSFWVARMGEMRFTLGLSGWTANDWTRGSALDLVAPPSPPPQDLVDRVAEALRTSRAATLAQLDAAAGGAGPAATAAALDRLAHAGQAIFDLTAGVYRWRQVLPRAIGEAEIGPESEELRAAKEIVAGARVKIVRRDAAPRGGLLVVGKVAGIGKEVELLLDGDGVLRKGTCSCSHHFKGGLRMGPCRHLLAVKFAAQTDAPLDASTASWYERLRRWSGG